MAGVRIIPETEFTTSEWSGGVTTELFIWPEGSSYGERRFRARISTARVELERSTFTSLPGVRRFLTPLCSGFELTVNGEKKLLPYGEVLEFRGDDAVECVGSGRDLNLMLKDADGRMSIVRGTFTVPENVLAFIYADSQSALAFCSEDSCTSAFLPAGAFAELEPGTYSVRDGAVMFEIVREQER